MKKIALLLAAALLAGCDYSVPLVREPRLDMDAALVGRWAEQRKSAKPAHLAVLPLSPREFMVAYPAGTDEEMFARATLWREGDRALVQLDWFGTAKGGVPDDGVTFQYVEYTLQGDTLHVRFLNPNVVPKEQASAESLAAAIAAHRSDPDVFHDERTFTRVKE